MADLKKREKRRANRTRKNQQAELIAKEDEQETPLDEEVPEIEIIGKDYGDDVISALSGPTSWEEVDAEREARQKANKVSDATYTVQDLVYNIARNPVMSPDEKGKAIGKVGSGFGKRVKEIVGETMEKEVDMDLLQLKALQARDSRHTSVIEKASDFIALNFSNLEPATKSYVRKWLKDTITILEKGGTDTTRELVPELIKSAKDLGIGDSSNSILIEKDASGSWRAVMWPSNNFKDLDRQIISEKAHLEYVDWVNKNMDCAPAFVIGHTPGTARESPVDFVAYESGFLLMSCPLTEKEAADLLRMQIKTDIGMSHGTLVFEWEPPFQEVVLKYRMVEVSDLPLERAANPFTDFDLLSKEADMDVKQYLKEMLGEERAEKYLAKTALKQENLRKAGVEEKEVKETATPATPVVENAQPVDVKELAEKLSKELGMKELSETLEGLLELGEKVPVLEALVKNLMESRDDELATKISPKAGDSLIWMKSRASQSDETVLDPKKKEDEKLKKSVPTGGWLAEALSVEPVNR